MSCLVWQPIVGCSYISSGCTNCKALALADDESKKSFVDKDVLEGTFWNGKIALNVPALNLPFVTVEPSTFVVCPYGDLFHENVLTDWVEFILDVMEYSSKHTFVVLTKRAARMNSFFKERYGSHAPKHILFGVSVEDQKYAEIRIGELADIPKFHVALYPLLGPVDLTPWLNRIYAVGVGDESERPAQEPWFDSIRESCARANIPFVRSSQLV